MKAIRRLLAAAAVLLFCLSLCAPVSVAETTDDYPSWEEITARILEEYEVDERSVHAGYRNLVTGEEHYLNGDEYAIAASMFKVPVCMLATELHENGSIDWSVYEQYFSFSDVIDDILIDSSNERAYFLCDNFLGGYNEFRLKTAPYMGVEPGSERMEDVMYNKYTAREFINCLSLLYNESERFPGIIETMQKAMTDRFFKFSEPRFRIAHKPGWISEDLILNDCGICFTTQPIALVLFSRGSSTSEEFLSAWCTAMCEYTEHFANLPSPAPEPTPAPALPTPVPATPAPAPAPAPVRTQLPMTVPVVAVGLFALIGLILIIRLCVRYRARFFGLFISLLLSTAVLLSAVAGVYYGIVYARPSGDPAASVVRFFNAICAGDYPAAYAELRDYSDLGLGESPGTPAGQKIWSALHASYSYALAGNSDVEMLNAVQPVRFTFLDLGALEEAVAAETQRQAEQIVQSRPTSAVYDENKRYRPEIGNEAYLAALEIVLQNAENYYTETSFDLSLTYADNRWQIIASPALLRALAGGIGY